MGKYPEVSRDVHDCGVRRRFSGDRNHPVHHTRDRVRHNAHNGLQQGGLPGARGAEYYDLLPTGHAERHALDSRLITPRKTDPDNIESDYAASPCLVHGLPLRGAAESVTTDGEVVEDTGARQRVHDHLGEQTTEDDA